MSVRRTVTIVALLSIAIALGAGLAVAVGGPTEAPANATLVSAYPNPVADGVSA